MPGYFCCTELGCAFFTSCKKATNKLESFNSLWNIFLFYVAYSCFCKCQPKCVLFTEQMYLDLLAQTAGVHHPSPGRVMLSAWSSRGATWGTKLTRANSDRNLGSWCLPHRPHSWQQQWQAAFKENLLPVWVCAGPAHLQDISRSTKSRCLILNMVPRLRAALDQTSISCFHSSSIQVYAAVLYQSWPWMNLPRVKKITIFL